MAPSPLGLQLYALLHAIARKYSDDVNLSTANKRVLQVFLPPLPGGVVTDDSLILTTPTVSSSSTPNATPSATPIMNRKKHLQQLQQQDQLPQPSKQQHQQITIPLSTHTLEGCEIEIVKLMHFDLLPRFLDDMIEQEDLSVARSLACWCFSWKTSPITSLSNFFQFPSPVNELDSRCHQYLVVFQITLLTLFDLFFDTGPLPYLYVVLGYLCRVTSGPRLDLNALFVLYVMHPIVYRYRLLNVSLVPSAPKRFAQAIGLLMSGATFALRQYSVSSSTNGRNDFNGSDSNAQDTSHRTTIAWAAWIVAFVHAIVSLLAATSGVCLGCLMFESIERLRFAWRNWKGVDEFGDSLHHRTMTTAIISTTTPNTNPPAPMNSNANASTGCGSPTDLQMTTPLNPARLSLAGQRNAAPTNLKNTMTQAFTTPPTATTTTSSMAAAATATMTTVTSASRSTTVAIDIPLTATTTATATSNAAAAPTSTRAATVFTFESDDSGTPREVEFASS